MKKSGVVAATGSLLLPLLLSACATGTTGAAALPAREFVGHLVTMERGNWFRPCAVGSEPNLFWVTFTGESVRQIDAARSEGIALVGDTAFVRWSAAETDEGMVGPGGPALLVREIWVVRSAKGKDCSTPADTRQGSSDVLGDPTLPAVHPRR